MENKELDWLCWWTQGFWQSADTSWRQSRFFSLSPALQRRFARRYPAELGMSLGISPAPLTAPEALVLSISALSFDARRLMLDLVADICAAGERASPLPPVLKIWCRRLAKGLRPGHWLPAPLFIDSPRADSLLLLKTLLPAVWPRLKLQFNSDTVTECEQRDPPVPFSPSRLRPLWDAVLWQCQRQESDTDVAG
ncbi:serine kinase [Sodalis sp. dw_96]|uniref:serine kinase n=1 Tax=Sodalis sp. dw_96 TaxID=2719794 RepID=UPI001BD3B1EC|nr:serine kinase [Sodalis sp. dw_96]